MSATELSKRYAKALMGLTKESGKADKALSELKSICGIFSADASIADYFANPLVAPEAKKNVIKASLQDRGISSEVVNLLLLLAENGRLFVLESIAEAYQALLDEEQGVTRGQVRSAKALPLDGQKALQERLSKQLNKKIVLSFSEDTSLLGGAVAQVGGLTFDDSLESHLKKLNEELNRRIK